MHRILKTLPCSVAAAGVMSACTAYSGTPEDMLGVQEAAIRYQFEHNHSGQQQAAKVFCVEMRQGQSRADPDDDMLKRLAGGGRLIRKRSACDVNGESLVVDRQTGVPGLIVSVGTVSWISASEATIEGGYYEASLSASSNLFHLQKVDGKWRVTRDELLAIA